MLESEIAKSITVVVIEVNNENYILEVNEVKEIYVPGEKIIPVPLADDSIIGIIDIRGEIYTIVSLKQKISNSKT